MDESFNFELDDEFGEFENARSRNISKNFEFMKSCGTIIYLKILRLYQFGYQGQVMIRML